MYRSAKTVQRKYIYEISVKPAHFSMTNIKENKVFLSFSVKEN